MRTLVLAAVMALAIPATSRADFVLDDFQTAGSIGSGSVLINSGFDRVFSGDSGNTLNVGAGLWSMNVQAGTSVSALYSLAAGSIDISGLSTLTFGLNLGQLNGLTGDWTIDVTLTDAAANSEMVSGNFVNPTSGPFGIGLGSISSSILADLQAVQITWSFNSNDPDTVFGTGGGMGGLVFTPEPGSLALLGGASIAGLAFLRRRRNKLNATT